MLDYANDKKNNLGQYFTPDNIVDLCLKNITLNNVIIEPSCGSGKFLNKLPKNALGIEIDHDLFDLHLKNKNCINLNFYDYTFEEDKNEKITFIGNPPYRTPAFSLKTHKKYLRELSKTYCVKGLKEEAMFFIIKTFDIFKKNNLEGNIGYIIPRSIFTGSSIVFKTFKAFCKGNMQLKSVVDIPKEFEGVGQDLVFAVWSVSKEKPTNENFILNNTTKKIDDFWCPEEDIIKFTDIFKKTYLGSVPAESFLMSCNSEKKEEFLSRLINVYDNDISEANVIKHLSYNDEPHLRALKNRNDKKIKRVVKDINFWKQFVPRKNLIIDNIKKIQHRKEERYYFRYAPLEKQKQFVYIINKNTLPSFYFPGNPTSTSTDYWGYCDYDVNRNCSPGANRSVPTSKIQENIKDSFLEYWKVNTNKNITEIFKYIDFVLKSDWYADYKSSHQRFYFSLPKKFLSDFNKT